MTLRSALAGNAAFSGANGLTLALAAPVVARVLGDVPSWTVRVVGVGLIGFAAIVAAQARAPARWAVLSIILADALWVVVSATALAAAGPRIPREGLILIATVALVVAAFATMQWVALARHQARASR